MKTAAITSLLFAGAALAVPVAEKRAYHTDMVIETVWTTTTVFVNQPTAAAFFEKGRWSSSSSSSSASSTSSAPPPPSSSAAPAPSVPVAAAAVVPSVAPASVAPVAAAPSAAAVSSGSTSGSGPSGTGDATYYEVNGTPGSCGTQKSDSDAVVALSYLVMNNGANSNSNPLCGKTINIQGESSVVQAVVYDTCEGCNAESIDLSPTLFKTAFPSGDGRVHNVKWWVD